MCVSYGIIEGLTRISRILFRCKQRVFSFGLNGKTPKDVYHQYSVPTILQVVTPISFLKKVILVSFLG